jgi:hypothetical protein
MRESFFESGTAAARATEVQILPGAARRISWGALFGGVVLAMAVQILLSVLGVGIGLTTVDPASSGSPSASSFGIGAGIWWTVSNLVALFVGGYVAARLAGVFQRGDGILHGLITWGFTLLLTFYLLTTAVGGVLGGAFSAIQGAASGAAQTATNPAAQQMAGALGLSPDQLEQRMDQMIAGQTNASPEQVAQAREQLAGLVPQLLQGGEPARQAREQATQIVAQVRGVPPEQVRAEVDQTLQQAQQQTAQAADKAANVASKGAIMAFIALLLGAAAAAWGGAVGARTEEDVVVTTHPVA